MSANTQGNRFIPFRKADLIEMGLQQGPLPETAAADFRELCRRLEALLHFEYHRLLEKIKDAYAPFDPDADTRRLYTLDDQSLKTHQTAFVREMTTLLNAANYEKITDEDLREALKEASLFKIRLSVDFNDFEEVLFFRRGEALRRETLTTWFGLRRRRIVFTHYDRVVVYIKFRSQAYFDGLKRRDLPYKPGSTLIKLFRNVPKADLEMLFPNSEVRMKTIDKLIIGIPAAVSGVVILVTKLGASLVLIAALLAFWMGLRETAVEINQQHLVALGIGLGTLAGFLFKQIGKFKNRKIRFMKALAENLYFKNLDNSAGVFHHLIDAAEEEEFKEAVLAYLFLAAAPGGLTRPQLDQAVEDWLSAGWDCRIDFEVDDALAKLERWELLHHEGHCLKVLAPERAVAQLDRIWHQTFAGAPAGSH